MQWIGRARFELRHEVAVERPRSVVLAVDQQSPAADLIRNRHEAQHDVGQQRSPEAMPLVPLVDAQPSEQGDRLRIPAGPLPQAIGWVLDGDTRHAPPVEPDDREPVPQHGSFCVEGGTTATALWGSHGSAGGPYPVRLHYRGDVNHVRRYHG